MNNPEKEIKRLSELNHELRKQLQAEHAESFVQRNKVIEAQAEHASLSNRIATLENELCTAKDQIPPDMEGDSLSVALIKLNDERHELRKLVPVPGKT